MGRRYSAESVTDLKCGGLTPIDRSIGCWGAGDRGGYGEIMARSRRRDGLRLIGNGDGELITIAQAADRLGLTPLEVRQRLDARELPTRVDQRTGVTVFARALLRDLAGEPSDTPMTSEPSAAPPLPTKRRARARTGSRQGTYPIDGTLESRGTAWLLATDRETLVVEVDCPAPSRLVGKRRQWVISYRGKRLPRLTPADLKGRPAKPPRRSVWTTSGGLPSLGKRR